CLRIALAHIGDFAAGSHQKFADVRLAGATPDRFVAQYPSLTHAEFRLRNKEPFALANESLVLSTVTILRTNSQLILQGTHAPRLQSFLRLPDTGRIARNRCHEPSSLVVATQEALLLGHALLVLGLGQEQQVAL